MRHMARYPSRPCLLAGRPVVGHNHSGTASSSLSKLNRNTKHTTVLVTFFNSNMIEYLLLMPSQKSSSLNIRLLQLRGVPLFIYEQGVRPSTLASDQGLIHIGASPFYFFHIFYLFKEVYSPGYNLIIMARGQSFIISSLSRIFLF